ncbi:unnamed protein product [Penicillium olsonii]|nr:unnamed protein product [Penicillium olsonii]CAG7932044.1 unnamed protein product [Penicillium olsonii]
MKFIIASVLLAASALAAPANVQRSNTLQISDFRASNSIINSASMHFVVTDANYPDDTPTECNLLWTYGNSPEQRARCNNNQYYIRFPDGPVDYNLFTLELERVSGPISEKGQAKLSSKTFPWKCVKDPKEGITIQCNYDGVLNMEV